MHIGNIYAMLGAWLSARSRGDDMLLRIEDIDEPRVVPGAAELMMDDLHWLGLDWDGDPVFQSARHDLYREALHCLENLTIDDAYDSPFDARNDHTPAVGSAPNGAIAGTTPLIYPCFCSRADIRAASAPQEGDRFMVYPGTCRRLIASDPDTVRRRLANGDRHSLRIAMPADTNPRATVQFDDAVFGHQEFNLARDVGDTIVRRADGLFSYQLVVVVDDLDMGVDDIVRGRDLLRSNALQIAIRRALIKAGFRKAKTQASAPSQHAPQSQYTPYNPENPRYAHLPLIDNAAGRRLAKRERSLDMGVLRAHGVTAEQVVGYCAWLLGLQGDSAHTSPQPMSAVEALQEFYEGVRLACEELNIDLAGGDTTASVTGLTVNVTAIGRARRSDIVYRNGAKPNDLICITGNLGAAYMGFQLLEREKRVLRGVKDPEPEFKGNEYLLQRYLKPVARKDIVELLAEEKIVPTSMIDLSDGLASDLLQICKASKCGARIYLDRIPIARQTTAFAEEIHTDPVVAALNGGEDYELLFTVPLALQERVMRMGGVDVIGHITAENTGAYLVTPDGGEIRLKAQGFRDKE